LQNLKTMKLLSKRLRPQDFLVDRPESFRKTGRNCNLIEQKSRYRGMNWSNRSSHCDHDPLVRVYSELHYLTYHAPTLVTRRWKQAALRLKQRCKWWKAGINDRL